MIPFRTQRMATSVVNRILNVRDGLAPIAGAGVPAAPDNSGPTAELAETLAAPKPEVSATPATAEAVALAPLVK